MHTQPENQRASHDNVERATIRFANGCACSQAIAGTYAPLFGIDETTVLKIAAGFAGGMRMGATCGAVTGAIMVLGLKSCRVEPTGANDRSETYELAREFVRRFEARNRTVVCNDLLGCDMGTPEGVQAARKAGLFETRCRQFVRDAAEILEDML